MASNFEFYSPTRVIFGKGTEQRVGALVREYGGTRVLIVYGGKSAVRSGVLDRAEKSLAEGLLRTVMKNAVILHTDPANYEARAEVMWAGSLSHNGLTGCGIASGDFMSHKLEHEMGGMFDVTHGAGLAALWPSWARYVYKDCLPRFVRFARNVMGVTTDGTDEEIALKGIEAMVDFYHSIGMPASFHELGIDPTDAQIDEMARRCLEACGSALGSAKKLSLDDMIAIYRAANH